jgi:hypothetical protein
MLNSVLWKVLKRREKYNAISRTSSARFQDAEHQKPGNPE